MYKAIIYYFTLCFFLLAHTSSFAQAIPQGYKSKGIVPVGYSDMKGKPAFKMSIKKHKDRWYLFTAHFWHSAWSVVDVTDVANPKVVKFIDGPPNTWTLQMELHGDIMITSLEKIFPDFGGNDEPFSEGVYIRDMRVDIFTSLIKTRVYTY